MMYHKVTLDAAHGEIARLEAQLRTAREKVNSFLETEYEYDVRIIEIRLEWLRELQQILALKPSSGADK